MTNGMMLLMSVIAIVLFFWGSWKAMKTQRKIYLLAMAPMGILIAVMFLI